MEEFSNFKTAKSAITAWYNQAASAAFAHVEAPPASGKSTKLVATLQQLAANKATILYAIDGSNREAEWIASKVSGKPKVDVLSGAFRLMSRVTATPASDKLLIFDYDEDLNVDFCLAMLQLAKLFAEWKGPSKLRVVWLASVPWDPLLSRIMAIFEPKSTLRVLRLRVGERHGADMGVANWRHYGGLTWTKKEFGSVMAAIRNDRSKSAVLVCRGANDDIPDKITAPNADVEIFTCTPADPKELWHRKKSIRPENLRHIVLAGAATEVDWEPRFLQVVTREATSKSALRSMLGCALAPGVRREELMVHSLVSRESVLAMRSRRRFESVHLESFILKALTDHDTLRLDTLVSVFAADYRRWSAAAHSLWLRGVMSGVRGDGWRGYRLGGDRSQLERSSQLLPEVDWNFAAAYLLGATVHAPETMTIATMIQLASVMAVTEPSHPYIYDRRRHKSHVAARRILSQIADDLEEDCCGELPPERAFGGGLWLALGLIRRFHVLTKTNKLEEWLTPSQRASVPGHTAYKIQDLQQRLSTAFEQFHIEDDDAEEAYWPLIEEHLLAANIERLVLITRHDDFARPDLRLMSCWRGDTAEVVMDEYGDGYLPGHRLQAVQGDFLYVISPSLEGYSRPRHIPPLQPYVESVAWSEDTTPEMSDRELQARASQRMEIERLRHLANAGRALARMGGSLDNGTGRNADDDLRELHREAAYIARQAERARTPLLEPIPRRMPEPVRAPSYPPPGMEPAGYYETLNPRDCVESLRRGRWPEQSFGQTTIVLGLVPPSPDPRRRLGRVRFVEMAETTTSPVSDLPQDSCRQSAQFPCRALRVKIVKMATPVEMARDARIARPRHQNTAAAQPVFMIMMVAFLGGPAADLPSVFQQAQEQVFRPRRHGPQQTLGGRRRR
ncbi:hypothetical protein K4K58_002113 [Colletotrichum sp. SAR11_239]|nr:hypothetical protein K4K58_002113 [Colletotrichum sp. SAR11_239]